MGSLVGGFWVGVVVGCEGAFGTTPCCVVVVGCKTGDLELKDSFRPLVGSFVVGATIMGSLVGSFWVGVVVGCEGVSCVWNTLGLEESRERERTAC